MITRNENNRQIKLFTATELISIAKKAHELCDINLSEDMDGWHISDDYPERRFDYIPCGIHVDMDYLMKFERLKDWMQSVFGCAMSLYIGYRGHYEDKAFCICIEPKLNILQ